MWTLTTAKEVLITVMITSNFVLCSLNKILYADNSKLLPAVKIFPAPVNTTALQLESSAICLKHSTISLCIKKLVMKMDSKIQVVR